MRIVYISRSSRRSNSFFPSSLRTLWRWRDSPSPQIVSVELAMGPWYSPGPDWGSALHQKRNNYWCTIHFPDYCIFPDYKRKDRRFWTAILFQDNCMIWYSRECVDVLTKLIETIMAVLKLVEQVAMPIWQIINVSLTLYVDVDSL